MANLSDLVSFALTGAIRFKKETLSYNGITYSNSHLVYRHLVVAASSFVPANPHTLYYNNSALMRPTR